MRRRLTRAIRAALPNAVLTWREQRYLRRYGELELRLVRHLCRPHQDAIDVGANEGAYVQFMRRHARRVYAFEPIPWLAERLTAKYHSNVVVTALALSRAAGIAHLSIPVVAEDMVTGLASLGGETLRGFPALRQIEVPTAALDEVYDGDVGFIKIDVEGHEEAVLTGAEATLQRCRPRLLVEIEERHAPGAIGRIAARLAALDYRGFFAQEGVLKPIEAFDAATMQRSEDLPSATSRGSRHRGYLNNFMFLPMDADCAAIADTLARLAPPSSG